MFALLNVVRTGIQCETRFKTIAKRKRNEDRNNHTSGHSRCNVVFEEEFAAIRAIDDSLEPEVLRGVNKVTYKRVPSAAHATAEDPNLVSSVSSNLDDNSQGFINTALPEQVENCRLHCDGTTPKGARPRNQRPSTDRMKHMKMFFDEMHKMNEQREARKEERERKREEARAQRHQEILQAHADYMDALRKIDKERRMSTQRGTP
ncbi:hypothetical protein HPB49_015214 [Dermacentor silvarum]|uniref:Uncharacterized protein n=1 Tax=Dermacentor silvarum TaxID=543639 RepID=A0ACB8D6A9_DERSI|nr:hypothetical protein HPB49_015214 [Dermacentor silvarum]